VLNVQRHDCRKKCFANQEENAEKQCRYGYPRRRCNADCWQAEHAVNGSRRYEYRCEKQEDERLSPYVPEWLLATGASMNIQYCDTTCFLAYIAKYITKPEPHGFFRDTAILREREQLSKKARVLNARGGPPHLGVPHALGDISHAPVHASAAPATPSSGSFSPWR